MLERLGEETCRAIFEAKSIAPVRKLPVIVREKWYHSANNVRTMIELLRRGFMFKEERLKCIREVMLFMLRHNMLQIDEATFKLKGHSHNAMRQIFYNYVCKALRGGPKDKRIPVISVQFV